MSPPRVDTSRRPVVVVWELTQACSLACRHCRADAQEDCHPDELTTAEGRALLDSAREFGEDQLVVLSGGDPMARDDVVDLVEYGTDLGLRMTLTPSGTERLTADRLDELADAGLRRVALSLDGGTPETHDDFRGEDGSFERTLRAARAATDAGLPLQLNTTVCADTVDELPAIRDLAEELGVVLWSVFFLVPVGRGAVLDPISPDRAEAVMEWLAEVADEAPFGLKTTEAPHYRRVRLQRAVDAAPDEPPESAPTRVVAGDGFVFVSHRGEIYPSGFLPSSVGNVREADLVERYREADLFEALRDPDALRGKCGACPFNHVCGGSRSRAYARTGDPLESDPLCGYVPPGYDGPLPERRPASRA
ncbi:MAG: radical SAM protein [Halobacteriales archaeon]|nr:radical SAM protein [Halobacteriales archaeon]